MKTIAILNDFQKKAIELRLNALQAIARHSAWCSALGCNPNCSVRLVSDLKQALKDVLWPEKGEDNQK